MAGGTFVSGIRPVVSFFQRRTSCLGNWQTLQRTRPRTKRCLMAGETFVSGIRSWGNSRRVNCASSRTPIMDFMPLPDGVTSHEPIPDLGGPDYDNKGFLGYDERQGWNLKALRKSDLDNARGDWYDYTHKRFKNGPSKDFRKAIENSQATRQDRAGSFIQTWILYGIFQEALNRPVLRNEASITTVLDPQTRCITVQSLFREFLEKLNDIVTDLPRAFHLLHCVSEAGFLLRDLDWSSEVLGFSIMPPFVYQALVVTITSIFQYVRVLLPTQGVRRLDGYGYEALDQQDFRRLDSYAFEVRDRQLIAKLEGRGWCRSLIKRVDCSLQIGGLFYASLFPKSPTGQHNECQSAVCTASNIDQDKYRIQHVPEYCLCMEWNCDHIQPICGCRSISMPETELRAAFAEEGFPLVRFQDDQIEIVRYTPDVEYVALSHVWSDGRGNPFSNALPICQLQMIDRYVDEVHFNTERLFWIDTLCVPIQKPLRNTAILRMATVYSSAACVLVLSAELLSTNLPSTHDETVFRIFSSTWNTRLWTMQEGVLASDLAFQFKNKNVRFRRLHKEILHLFTSATDKCHNVSRSASRWLSGSLRMTPSRSRGLSVERFCTAIEFRSTSRPSDVAICGSVLLGSDLDLERVLGAPDDRKMETFWMCLKKISVGVLWSRNVPRLKQDGFRWAPSNLLEPGGSSGVDRSDLPEAEVTATGLLLNGVEAILMENVALPRVRKTGEEHFFRFGVPGSPQRYVTLLSRCKHDFSDLRNLWTGQLVLLLEQLPNPRAGSPAALVMPVDEIMNESCVDVGTLIYARYICTIYIFQEDVYLPCRMPAGATDYTAWINKVLCSWLTHLVGHYHCCGGKRTPFQLALKEAKVSLLSPGRDIYPSFLELVHVDFSKIHAAMIKKVHDLDLQALLRASSNIGRARLLPSFDCNFGLWLIMTPISSKLQFAPLRLMHNYPYSSWLAASFTTRHPSICM